MVLNLGYTLESPEELLKNFSDWTIPAEILIHMLWIRARGDYVSKAPRKVQRAVPAALLTVSVSQFQFKSLYSFCVVKVLSLLCSTRSESQFMTLSKINNKEKLWNTSFSLKTTKTPDPIHSLGSRQSAHGFFYVRELSLTHGETSFYLGQEELWLWVESHLSLLEQTLGSMTFKNIFFLFWFTAVIIAISPFSLQLYPILARLLLDRANLPPWADLCLVHHSPLLPPPWFSFPRLSPWLSVLLFLQLPQTGYSWWDLQQWHPSFILSVCSVLGIQWRA